MTDSRVTVVPVVTPAAPVRPEGYDAATQAALEHIDGQAVRAVADGGPERTRKGYAQDWASWMKFCGESGVPLLAVTPGTLVMFVEWLWTQPGWKAGTCTAPSTVDRRISGTVVSARAEHGVKLEEGVARLARNRLRQAEANRFGREYGVVHSPARASDEGPSGRRRQAVGDRSNCARCGGQRARVTVSDGQVHRVLSAIQSVAYWQR